MDFNTILKRAEINLDKISKERTRITIETAISKGLNDTSKYLNFIFWYEFLVNLKVEP